MRPVCFVNYATGLYPILPRVAGEDEGGGLIVLNDLNDLNDWNDSNPHVESRKPNHGKL